MRGGPGAASGVAAAACSSGWLARRAGAGGSDGGGHLGPAWLADVDNLALSPPLRPGTTTSSDERCESRRSVTSALQHVHVDGTPPGLC